MIGLGLDAVTAVLARIALYLVEALRELVAILAADAGRPLQRRDHLLVG